MKKILVAIVTLFSLLMLSTVADAATCGAKFMKDPCPVDGYSIVNTEKFVRGRHNWMHDVHHFGEHRGTTRVKRIVRKKRVHSQRAYRYVRHCRIVKVRR